MNGKHISDLRTFHKMDFDSDPSLMKPDSCRRKTNIRSGSVEGEFEGACENFMGTEEVTNPYYESGDVIIGSVSDEENDAIIFLVYNSDPDKHKIIQYWPYRSGTQIDLILKHKYLNFQLDSKITDVDIIDGLKYWTDGHDNGFTDLNPPRKINIAKAKAYSTAISDASTFWAYTHIGGWTSGLDTFTYYRGPETTPFVTGKKVVPFTDDGDVFGMRHEPSSGYCEIVNQNFASGQQWIYTDRPWGGKDTPNGGASPQARSGKITAYATDTYFGIDWQVLDRIKHPPNEAPSVSYTNDTTQSVNKLRNNLFQFCYRWVYDDNEKSVFSPISEVPLPSTPELLNGAYDETAIVDNVINVWANTGSMEVRSVELAMRKGNTGNWSLINREYKYDQDGDVLLANDIYSVYHFYNNEVGEPLVQDDVSRPFDFVPQVSGVQELIEKNRLIDADYTEGYDNLDIDVTLSIIKEAASIGEVVGISSYKSYLWEAYAYAPGAQDLIEAFYIDMARPETTFEVGYTYIITIDGYPYKNEDINGWMNTNYGIPEPFEGTYIRGSAVVERLPGMTMEEFQKNIITQLRYVSGTSSVIAMKPIKGSALTNPPTGTVGDEFATFGGYTEIYWKAKTGSGLSYGFNPINKIMIFCAPNDIDHGVGAFLPATAVYGATNITITKISGYDKGTTYKAGSNKQLAVFYKDRAGRESAAQTSSDSQIYIPYYSEGGDTKILKNKIAWSVAHPPPEWAVEWTWGLAKDSSISYFIDACVASIGYSGIGDMLYVDVNTYIVNSIDTNPKINIRPYEWAEGDRLRFSQQRGDDNDWFIFEDFLDFEITGTYLPTDIGDVYQKDIEGAYITTAAGNKIPEDREIRLLINNFDYDSYNIVPGNTIVEIYRPTKTQETLLYQQAGSWMKVLDAHTVDRRHSGDGAVTSQNQTATLPATGILSDGDTYLNFRFMWAIFPCESQNYSDFYKSDDVSLGRPNLVNRDMRRKRYISNLRWGGIFIQDSLTNDLSKFKAEDFYVLAEKFEDIESMEEVGYTLRILQKNKPTSIYIGKAGLKQANVEGQDIITISENVIGAVMVSEKDYGTAFPESVVKSASHTYFFDIYNGVYCRWAENGIFPISDYDAKKFFRDKSRALLESGVENVNIYATYEEEFDNLIITFKDSINSANNETIFFHEPDNAWTQFATFTPDYYGSIGIILAGSLAGRIYLHNVSSTRNAFYIPSGTSGESEPSSVEFVGNKSPADIKVYNSLEVLSNEAWGAPNAGDIYVPLPGNNMQSRLKATRFINREGKWIASFLRDMFTSGVSKVSDLVNGRPLRGRTINITLQNTSSDEVVLLGANINQTISE